MQLPYQLSAAPLPTLRAMQMMAAQQPPRPRSSGTTPSRLPDLTPPHALVAALRPTPQGYVRDAGHNEKVALDASRRLSTPTFAKAVDAKTLSFIFGSSCHVSNVNTTQLSIS